MTGTQHDDGPEQTKVFRTYFDLDPHHGATLGLLTDAHAGHRLTMSAFAYQLEQNPFYTGYRATGQHPDHRMSFNILWGSSVGKVRHTPQGPVAAPVRVIIDSDIEPRFDHQQAAYWQDAILGTPSVRTVELAADEGSEITYQIVVSPRSNHRVDGYRRTRVATTEPEVQEWWSNKATASGLALIGTPVIDKAGVTSSTQRENLTIRHVRITGKATVTDAGKYAKAVHRGIGAGKAYGCGMLLTR
ncbi:type I-E CRISPR-associated protein Cas6/Cse3/CasE [Mycolicibacterium conceptionense]|uniref:type I-E CRISPR-associated protein Cas6/Cse3/CasE n=1 Tax=Mycolicibacterium conceptionense TaxID=451644 RepID=UPI00066245E1|nr:type I-E CRISPR-associated protein Cas6/Cse3/CasE [Mycolicibacterium conceptionense]